MGGSMRLPALLESKTSSALTVLKCTDYFIEPVRYSHESRQPT